MPRLPFISIFWRSFFIQAFWNYPRMLGSGFLFALLPAARTLFPERERRIEFLRRHAGYFNSQPYCASLALGMVLRQEQDLAGGSAAEDEAGQGVVQVKENLCGPLGLIGDQIYWQLLKPEAAAAGMIGALLLGGAGPAAALAGAVLLLLAFNPLHLWMRWWGLQTGYRAGTDLSGYLAGGVLPALRRKLTTAGIALALPLAVVGFTFARREWEGAAAAAFLLGFALAVAAVRRRWPWYVTLTGTVLAGLLPVLMDPA
ncbi:MAG: PTS mannose/fructose/sorbose transporter family subunit IID [Candidatus Zixiibacteriota bacterium]|nr:MAG: PTS mannose/fructose/sorbose transporter family subunit IID [candidate division Zixibacteria bacterium]